MKLQGKMLLSFVILILFLSIAWSEENSNITCVSKVLSSMDHTTSVEIEGSYAYVIDEYGGLIIFDTTTPEAPIYLNFLNPPSHPSEIAVAGDYAYIADPSVGLIVVDISDPTNPIEVGCCNVEECALDVQVLGGYAYVIVDKGPVEVIDISDPSNPQIIGNISSWNYCFLKIIGNYAYVGEHEGLQIYDMTNSTNPQLLGVVENISVISDISVVGNTVYVLSYNSGMYVIDQSTITAPVVIGSVSIDGNLKGLEIKNNHVYIVKDNSEQNLVTVDITNPTNPQLVNNSDLPREAYDICIKDNCAYIADTAAGLMVVNIAIPTAPEEIYSYNIPGNTDDIALKGDYIYVANGYGNLRIYNKEDVNSVQEVGIYTSPNESGVNFVKVVDNYAYLVSSIDESFSIVDITNPLQPTELGTYVLEGMVNDLGITGNHAVVYDNPYISSIDISNPAQIQLTSRCDAPQYITAIAVDGNYVYIVIWEGTISKMLVYNIVDPSAIQLVGTYNFAGNGKDITVCGGYAYIADCRNGLLVVDVSNPSYLQLVSSYTTYNEYEPTLVTVANNYAYIGLFDKGFMVIDISNPLELRKVGYYKASGTVKNIVVQGNYAYVSTNSSFGIYDCSQAVAISDENEVSAKTVLKQNYPNPFNPTTNISFTVAKQCPVRLDVYNIRGQHVRSLLDETCMKGEHSVVFNGCDDSNQSLSSGMYLYKLQTGSENITQKMLLLK